MSDTSFSIELQGLNLPDEVTNRLQAELRSVVMSEIAKTDLGGELSIEPLTASKGFPDLRHILGLIIRNGGNLATQARAPSGLIDKGLLQPPSPIEVTMPPPGLGATPLLDGASLADVLDEIYYRPDIRAAIVANTRAFAQLLSRDDVAMQVFNQLTSGPAGSPGTTAMDTTQKPIGAAVGVVLLVGACFVAGGIVGYLSRPK
jgi:hypothetical protein